MKTILSTILLFLAFANASIFAQDSFHIKVERIELDGNLVIGKISVNGTDLGTSYENENLKILPGTYPGFMRYSSTAGHVTGPLGNIGQDGDFLLEIGQVKWSDGKKRNHLLFHGGNKPHHSKGCVMLGAVSKDADGKRYLPEGHTLRKLRKAFYGTEEPMSTPNKKNQD